MNTSTALEKITKSDIIKSGTLGAQFQNISISEVLISILVAFIIGCVIAIIYKKTYRGVLYSPNFPITLIMLTLITTPVVMCIKSDIALSMGMVGALSIVRFRTAVKDPIDTAYMFWALTMGILIGAGLHIIAFCVVLVMSVFVALTTFLQFKKPDTYLLVIHCQSTALSYIDNTVKTKISHNKMRSKTITHAGAEVTYEIRLQRSMTEDALINDLRSIADIYDVTLVACQTEAGS